jgi:hypothetical protein
VTGPVSRSWWQGRSDYGFLPHSAGPGFRSLTGLNVAHTTFVQGRSPDFTRSFIASDRPYKSRMNHSPLAQLAPEVRHRIFYLALPDPP